MEHHLRLVCLQISDDAAYARYRTEMAPILERFGGHFVLDVEGSASVHPANFEPTRVLLIAFASPVDAQGFFADPGYQSVRATWFEPAVRATFATSL